MCSAVAGTSLGVPSPVAGTSPPLPTCFFGMAVISPLLCLLPLFASFPPSLGQHAISPLSVFLPLGLALASSS